MHVSIVGNAKWDYSAERDWQSGFVGVGHSCEVIDEKTSSAKTILGAAEKSDLLLWISANSFHTKETFQNCQSVVRVVGWHADLFWGLSRKNWQNAPVWNADVVYTADGGHDDLWEKMGVNHRWLLPGVKSGWVAKRGVKRDNYECDVAFVGNDGSSYHAEWPYRGRLVGALREMCLRNGWTFKNPGGASRKIERDRRMNDFYKSARVTVGDSLCLDYDKSKYWSDRVYEATGRGGVLIMPEIDALKAETGGWLPTYPWGDWEALEGVVGDLVASGDRRDALSAQGKLWAGENHTYETRVTQLLIGEGHG